MGITSIEVKQYHSFFRWLFNKPKYAVVINSQLSREIDDIFDWCNAMFGEARPQDYRWKYRSKRWRAQSTSIWAVIYLYNIDDITLFKLRWLPEVERNIY